MNTLKIKKLHPDAIVPTRSHPHDAGLDLYALEDTAVLTNTTDVIRTGIAVDIPPGYEAQVRPRSGVSLKTSFKVILGTVDSGYTGEIKIILQNFQDPYLEIQDEFIERGMKIAQLVISPIVTPTVELVEEFDSESARGTNGFGSTDR